MGNKSIHSLFVINDFPPILGGQSTYFYYLFKGLPSDKILVLAPRKKGCANIDKEESYPIIRKPYVWTIPFVEKIFKIVYPFFIIFPLLRKHKIKILHCGHVLSTGVVGLLYKKLFKQPYYVYTFASDILEYQKFSFLKKLLISILKEADKVVTISEYTKTHLNNLGVSNDKIIIIAPRIDAQRFTENQNQNGLDDRLMLKDKKVVLSVNRLVQRKGNDRVIRSMIKVKKKIPDVKYLIVGQGPYKQTLEDMVISYNLQDCVLFVDPEIVDEYGLGAFYHRADAFIMASRVLNKQEDAEGFGIVFLEANACKKPVIGGDSGGIRDAIENHKSGLLVNPNSEKDIAQSILDILEDPELAKRMGDYGQKRVKDIFDYRSGIPELQFLFED